MEQQASFFAEHTRGSALAGEFTAELDVVEVTECREGVIVKGGHGLSMAALASAVRRISRARGRGSAPPSLCCVGSHFGLWSGPHGATRLGEGGDDVLPPRWWPLGLSVLTFVVTMGILVSRWPAIATS